VRLPRRKSQNTGGLTLPAKSAPVTLVQASGERIHARIAERAEDSLLVLALFKLERSLAGERLQETVIEFTSDRGRVRLRGTVSVEGNELLRFTDLYSTEVLQEREFVRVKSTRPVLVSSGSGRASIQSYSVDLSGGGMLLAGPSTLKIGEVIQFRLTTNPGAPPIVGSGTVVRTDVRGHRGVSFDSIGEGDQRRLVRFLFECQRSERRRGLDREQQNG
jgi:c-di-GMP-binding flagellar brake protein YcgR